MLLKVKRKEVLKKQKEHVKYRCNHGYIYTKLVMVKVLLGQSINTTKRY